MCWPWFRFPADNPGTYEPWLQSRCPNCIHLAARSRLKSRGYAATRSSTTRPGSLRASMPLFGNFTGDIYRYLSAQILREYQRVSSIGDLTTDSVIGAYLSSLAPGHGDGCLGP